MEKLRLTLNCLRSGFSVAPPTSRCGRCCGSSRSPDADDSETHTDPLYSSNVWLETDKMKCPKENNRLRFSTLHTFLGERRISVYNNNEHRKINQNETGFCVLFEHRVHADTK
jgi:hypothetical protein